MGAFNLFDRPTIAATQVSALFAAAAILLGAHPATATIAYSGGTPTSMSLDGVTSAVQVTDGKVTRLGGLSALPTLTRTTPAYGPDGTEYAAGAMRYRYGRNLLTLNQSTAGDDTNDTTGFGFNNAAVISRDTTWAWKGTGCIKVVAPGALSEEGVYVDYPSGDNLTPGEDVTVSVYVVGSGTVYVGVQEFESDNTYVGVTKSANTAISGAVQRITVTRTFTTGTKARIIVRTPTAQAITFRIDGLQIEQAATATNWDEGGPQGGLIEDGATTLNLWSDALDNGYWDNTSVTRTPNATTAPDGTLTADKVVAQSIGGTVVHRLFKPLLFTPSSAGVQTIYAKAAEETQITLTFDSMSTQRATFDLSTGVIVSSLGVSTEMVYVHDGWYRCSIFTSSVNTGHLQVYLRDGSGYIGDDVSGVYLWRFNGFLKGYVVSPIKSEGAVATCNADTLTAPIGDLMNADEGTAIVKFRLDTIKGADWAWLLIPVTGGTSGSGFYLGVNVSRQVQLAIGDGVALQAIFTTTLVTANTDYTAAVKWKKSTGEVKLFLNGVLEASFTRPIAPVFTGLLQFGGQSSVTTRGLNGTLYYVRFFDKAIDDTVIALYTPTYRPDVEPERQRVVIPFNGSLAYKARVATLTYDGSELAGITGEHVTIAA